MTTSLQLRVPDQTRSRRRHDGDQVSRNGRPPSRLTGLDGLRALAVVAVLLYHFGVSQVSGGFLGVDVFFVLSGYLITSQLWARWGETSVRLGAFWRGRVRRLLPAVLLLAAGSTAAVALGAREQLESHLGDLAAATTYTSNWWYVIHHRSYFESSGRPPVLQHLWSLAVEEQFYLVWPLVVAAVFALSRRQRTRRAILLLLAAGLAALSAIAMGVGTAAAQVPQAGDASRFYFGTDTHASGLLVGAALALWRSGAGFGGFTRTLPRARPGSTLLGVASLAVVSWAFVGLDEFTPWLYRWGFAAFAVVTAGLVAVATRDGLLSRVLGSAVPRWLGERSYGLYLWHWPIASFTRPGLDLPLDGVELLTTRIALCLVAAELSLRLVERPIRTRGWAGTWHRLAHVRGGGLAALAMGVAIFVIPCGVAASVLAPPSAAESGPSIAVPSAGSAAPGPASSQQPGGRPGHGRAPGHPRAARGADPDRSPAKSTGSLTVYGDSVALGADPGLRREFTEVTMRAVVAEQAWNLLPRLARDAAAGNIPDGAVLLHTGDNGTIPGDQLRAALDALKDRTVIVVSPSVPRPWQRHNIAVLDDVLSDFPAVRRLRWDAISGGHPEWFVSDGIHLKGSGQIAYARAIRALAG
jgi:peptidoglycan/LPS O-acetylase OafA/YrhL